jgi:hypothetical protein
MTRKTFILILCIYGFLLGGVMFLFPAFAVANFGGDITNIDEVSTMRFFGALHLGFNFIGLSIRKTADSYVLKAYFLGTAFVFLASIGVGLFYTMTGQVPMKENYWIDISIWAVLALGCLYFWNKEHKDSIKRIEL